MEINHPQIWSLHSPVTVMSEPCSLYKQANQALHREERGPDLDVTESQKVSSKKGIYNEMKLCDLHTMGMVWLCMELDVQTMGLVLFMELDLQIMWIGLLMELDLQNMWMELCMEVELETRGLELFMSLDL